MLAPWRAEFSVRQFGGPVTPLWANAFSGAAPSVIEGSREKLLNASVITHGSEKADVSSRRTQ
jgi:hypothetical protein